MIKLPRKVKVGCIKYDIIYPHSFYGIHDDLLGLCSSTSSKIFLTNRSPSGLVNDQKLTSVFLHEILHAIDYLFLYSALEEKTIDIYANSLFQVFKYNDIEIKNKSHFPEVINVLGFDYDVIMSNDFPGAANHTFYISHDTSNIYLSDTDGEITFSDTYLKLNLIASILHSINSICNLDYDNIETITRQLANGVYMVFSENNLEELIKNCV
jgi:hypothetical protein